MMTRPPFTRLLTAFVTALITAIVLGAIVQTQFNVNALNGIGAEIGFGTRVETTFRDIFSGFSLTYGGYVVLPAFLVAFVVAWYVARLQPSLLIFWYTLAGTLAVFIGIPLVHYLSPLALVFGATRDMLCLILMALAGGVAGFVFVRMIQPPHNEMTTRPGQPAPA